MGSPDSTIRGYVTATFDGGMHSGHIRFLNLCRARCGHLTVGLVTDEVAAMQKRAPMDSFHERRTILEALSSVDEVVEHRGETKQVALKKLRFDVLFTGDDYFEKEEYASFERDHPEVPVYYFPYSSDASTTDRMERMNQYVEVVAYGLQGAVMRSNKVVWKQVSLGNREYRGDTSDAYGLFRDGKYPRNWKWVTGQKFPNIPGVNMMREVALIDVLSGYGWYPVTSSRLVYEARKPFTSPSTDPITSSIEERRHPAATFFLYMPYLEHTLESVPNPRSYVAQVRQICDDLCTAGVVHGDIHARNLMVSNGQVYLLDFGWSLHRSFHMTVSERTQYDQWIADDFDWTHFKQSCSDLFRSPSGTLLVEDGITTALPKLDCQFETYLIESLDSSDTTVNNSDTTGYNSDAMDVMPRESPMSDAGPHVDLRSPVVFGPTI